MKKLFTAMLVIINLNCFAQTKNWFVSFSIAPAFGGPSASLKSQMKAQGYGDQAESTFHIFGSGTTSYPRGGSTAYLLRGGKKISDRKSIYFVAGISEKATVEGFHSQGWSDGLFGLFSGTYGKYVAVSYTTYQLTAGYMYSFSNSRAKLGFGPSVYILNYGTSTDYSEKDNHSSFVPGASFTARLPFGKERKLFGIELVFEGNMAPPIQMKSDHTQDFQPKNANMFSGNIGLAFSFRK
jgi:hypothetical protein